MKDYIKQFIDKNGEFYQKIKLSNNIEIEKETGFLYCKGAVLGHLGVQAYNGFEIGLTDKKVVYVKREERDVFDEDSLASIEGKPITLGHPDEMVNSKNSNQYIKGFVKNVRRDGDNILGDLVIHDMTTIEKIQSGEMKDLSLGYNARLISTGDGQLKQTEIVVNHLAIVGEGRAINARIMDENTVVLETEGSDDLALFKKSKEEKALILDENEKETLEDEEEKEELEDEEEVELEDTETEEETDEDKKKKEGEKKVMTKDFNYFISEFNKLKDVPKSDFRDKAYEALNVECKEVLGVDLPTIEAPAKISVIDKSVGLADNMKVEEESSKPKKAILDAKEEERYYDRLYRKMDDPAVARKLGSMTYRDVIDQAQGRDK